MKLKPQRATRVLRQRRSMLGDAVFVDMPKGKQLVGYVDQGRPVLCWYTGDDAGSTSDVKALRALRDWLNDVLRKRRTDDELRGGA